MGGGLLLLLQLESGPLLFSFHVSGTFEVPAEARRFPFDVSFAAAPLPLSAGRQTLLFHLHAGKQKTKNKKKTHKNK